MKICYGDGDEKETCKEWIHPHLPTIILPHYVSFVKHFWKEKIKKFQKWKKTIDKGSSGCYNTVTKGKKSTENSIYGNSVTNRVGNVSVLSYTNYSILISEMKTAITAKSEEAMMNLTDTRINMQNNPVLQEERCAARVMPAASTAWKGNSHIFSAVLMVLLYLTCLLALGTVLCMNLAVLSVYASASILSVLFIAAVLLLCRILQMKC